MNYNVRISDNFLKADHADGEVLQHTDLNELESVVKTAINANYTDIQKLQDGVLPVSGAESLKGTDGVATLSQFINESLQESDNKVPTSMQVKKYVDSLSSSAPIVFNPTFPLVLLDNDLKDDGRILGYFSASFNDITQSLLNRIGSVNVQVIYNLNINGLPLTFIGLVTSLEKTDTVHKATIELTSLGIAQDILDKTKYAHYKITHSPHWEINIAGNWVRVSNEFVITKVQV